MSEVVMFSEFTQASAKDSHKRAIDGLIGLFNCWSREMRLRCPDRIHELEEDLLARKKTLQVKVDMQVGGFSDIEFSLAEILEDGKLGDKELLTSFVAVEDDERID